MTEEEEMDASWEPWETEAMTNLNITDLQGAAVSAPFAAYAPTFGQAKVSMKLHLGILLRQHGYHPSWLRED